MKKIIKKGIIKKAQPGIKVKASSDNTNVRKLLIQGKQKPTADSTDYYSKIYYDNKALEKHYGNRKDNLTLTGPRKTSKEKSEKYGKIANEAAKNLERQSRKGIDGYDKYGNKGYDKYKSGGKLRPKSKKSTKKK